MSQNVKTNDINNFALLRSFWVTTGFVGEKNQPFPIADGKLKFSINPSINSSGDDSQWEHRGYPRLVFASIKWRNYFNSLNIEIGFLAPTRALCTINVTASYNHSRRVICEIKFHVCDFTTPLLSVHSFSPSLFES